MEESGLLGPPASGLVSYQVRALDRRNGLGAYACSTAPPQAAATCLLGSCECELELAQASRMLRIITQNHG